ncbi:hypothetical protein M885DRAFT_523985 [Pelagophyceae sp. CCMP2097]|nr:hypothetical protein M885DRAFT_523985 [Pelagophyceae sp. CCMP2097]|mmetsp:Transcript_16354/g.55196  ORF Transcript_16354/g.55196 Transcript_16354/m.55196 type:complete len:308 (-) Transcript_16354:212-1135(-)
MTESGQSLSSFGLCLAARKSVVDKQMGADPSLPGPGTYINPLTEGRNSNGEVKGVLSTQKNAPSNSFAHHGMKDYGRPIETLNSADRMGPKYDLDNITCGRQVQSRIRTAPSATFGSGAQRQSGGGVSKRGADPSPQHYDTQLLSTGIIRLSTQRGVTGTKFMTGPRTYNDSNARASSASPAPGQYRPQSGIGNQVESKYRGGHSFSIRGGRKDFTAQNAGKQPGPGHYIDPNKEGRAANGEVKVVLSSQRSFASAVFGTAEQRPSSAGLARTEKRPGPNQYLVPGAMGSQVNSRYKTAMGSTFGAR